MTHALDDQLPFDVLTEVNAYPKPRQILRDSAFQIRLPDSFDEPLQVSYKFVTAF
jgi:hypothetical protein